MRSLRFLPLFCILIVVPRLAAQIVAPSERTINGQVIDSISGRALKGTVLYFTTNPREHTSGNDGRFRIEHVSSGDTLLVVRRIGFVPARISLILAPSDSVVDIGALYLRPVATELDRIAVEAEEVRLYPQLSDFYRRKQQRLPGGEYITREDLERSGVRKTSGALARSAKIEMVCPNTRLGDDACVARNRRGRDVRLVGSARARNPQEETGTQDGKWSFDRCEMEIFVDGQRSTLQPDEIPVSWIAGIEVYSGPSTTPAAFGQGRCGVIAIWTVGTRGQ